MSDTNTRWGVWCVNTKTGESRWVLREDESGEIVGDSVHTSHASAENSRRQQRRKSGREWQFEVRPYPAPTPPATVEGEYTIGALRRYDDMHSVSVHDDAGIAAVFYSHTDEKQSVARAKRFLDANTLAAENKRLREALEQVVALLAVPHDKMDLDWDADATHLDWDAKVERSVQLARTALAGGPP